GALRLCGGGQQADHHQSHESRSLLRHFGDLVEESCELGRAAAGARGGSPPKVRVTRPSLTSKDRGRRRESGRSSSGGASRIWNVGPHFQKKARCCSAVAAVSIQSVGRPAAE